MKKVVLICATFLLATGCIQTTATPKPDNTLIVYTYASLNDPDYGLLPKIIPDFEKANGAKVKVVTFADTGAMVNQLVTEKDHPQADVVIGIDNSDVARLAKDNLFTSVTPFDYSYIAFIYDTTQLSFPEPIGLADLATPAYDRKLIIEQPGLSSPGTQLLLWAQAALGEAGADQFWQGLAANHAIVAPDWNTAYYTDFLSGQAPIVLSYTTSPAYHIDQEGSHQYAAIPMKDGYVKQTEEIALTSGSLETTLGQLFVQYLTSASVQNQIPTTQWMIPAGGDDTTWPAAYSEIITPTPDQELTLADKDIAQHYNNWLRSWNSTFGL